MKIVIAGNYGAKNLGDEMILEGILEMLRAVVPSAQITILSGNPEETKKKHKVNAELKFPAGIKSFIKSLYNLKSKTGKTVKNCDYFILGGGGLFGSLTFKANIIWGIQALMAYLYKKPVIMYGQGIGKVKGKISKFIVRKLFRKAELIVVRDEDSKKQLKSIAVHKKIHTVPDMAFRIAHKSMEKTRPKNQLIVALRQMENLSLLFKKNIADFVNWLIDEKKWQVKFVDFQDGEKEDYHLHEDIISMLNDPSQVEHFYDAEEKKEIFELFARSTAVLGMRLHSIITAIKTETPFIAINYAPKVEALLNYAKLREYLLNMNETDTENLKDLFNKSEKNKTIISKKLREFNLKALKRHHEMEKILRNMFASSVH